MIPRTKNQLEVERLAAKLPAVGAGARSWIVDRLFSPVGYSSGRTIWCSECGHSFGMEEGKSEVKCPHCGKLLKVESSRKRKTRELDWALVPTTINGWQVLRYYLVFKDSFKDAYARFEIHEVAQYWMKPDGTKLVRQKPKIAFYYGNQPFCYNAEMRLVKRASVLMGDSIRTYRKGSILPEFRRMGVTTNFHDCDAVEMLGNIGRKPYLETLLKAGRYGVLGYALNRPEGFAEIEDAVRICVRHRYDVQDVQLYHDYITAAKYCGADVRNPKLACPADLHKAHDEMVERMDRIKQRKELEEKLDYQPTFLQQKSKFFGVDITDGEIHIVPLKSIKEFQHEGNILHHCVFKHSYFKQENSLILSARIDGASIETIELSLNNYSIMQCQGDHNQHSEMHNRIVKLMKDNVSVIRRINKSKQISYADTHSTAAGRVLQN